MRCGRTTAAELAQRAKQGGGLTVEELSERLTTM